MQLFYGVLLLLVVVNFTECYKILIIFPAPSPSHYILGNALGKGLANAGHDVTMVSPFEDKTAPKNYRNVLLTGFKNNMQGSSSNIAAMLKNSALTSLGSYNCNIAKLTSRRWAEAVRCNKEEKKEVTYHNVILDDKLVDVFDLESAHPWAGIFIINIFGEKFVKDLFEHENFKRLLNEKFDVVIFEQFKSDALKVLQCHFQTPIIIFSTVGPFVWVNEDVGNPSPPSYVPDVFLGYTSNMNIWQRTFNSLTTVFHAINNYLIFYPAQRKLIEQYFPHCANNELVMNNVSLILLNSHESTNQPVPLVPNMIQIGGFHVSPPKELPKDLKEYLDNAKEGVVYFSMGSNIVPSKMKTEIREALTKALGKLKQKVIWKYDEDTLPGKPDNVKLGKWFPQSDILAHPNVKLFVTHGGLLSTLETVDRGVPVLCLPVFGDQKMNAARAVAFGYGLKVPFSEITEERLTKALNELLNNSKYRTNVLLRSKLSHDRPMKPMDVAVYWTEFVARHRGAPHLKVAGVDLSWYQYLLLDVILLIGLIAGLLLFVLKVILKKLFCSRKDKKKKD